MTTRKPRKAPPKKPTVNLLFPGRPNYEGPDKGYFAMLHHQQLFERTRTALPSVKMRVRHVATTKPRHEIKVRLQNMMYLGWCPQIKAVTKLEEALRLVEQGVSTGTYELRRPIEQAIERTKAHIRTRVIAYIAKHNPKHAWVEDENCIKGT